MKQQRRIGPLLKHYRENCGLTQQQVANILNVDRSTYTYYETGNTVPSALVILKLSRIFNVHYSIFMDGFLDDEEDAVAEASSQGAFVSEKETIYNLNKQERQLVGYFRNLNRLQKEELLKQDMDSFLLF